MENFAKGFGERRSLLLDSIRNMKIRDDDVIRMTMHRALALLATAHARGEAKINDGVRVNELASALTLTSALGDIRSCNLKACDDLARCGVIHEGMFFAHVNMDAYLRFGSLYDESLRELVKNNQLNYKYNLESGTENHKIMNATAGYLASQTWGDPVLHEKCRSYILGSFHRMTRYGLGEFDSTTYGAFYLNSLATMFDFAKDEEMKRKCGMVLDFLLASMSAKWFGGLYVGAHSRDYHPLRTEVRRGASLPMLWLYFGGLEPDLSEGEAFYSAINAISSYAMPEILFEISCDYTADELYESFDLNSPDAPSHDNNETKAVGGARGFGYISKVGVRKYTYTERHFALGSMYDGICGDIIWSGQMRRWSLDWLNGALCGTFFFTHPFPDFNVNDKSYRDNLIGSSPFEQLMQAKNTMIALYNIPEGGSYKYAPRERVPSDIDPYIEGVFANAIRIIREKGDWIFCHCGTIMFAVRMLNPYKWTGEKLNDGWAYKRIRSEGLANGLILEVREAVANPPAGEETELDAFMHTVLDNAEKSLRFSTGSAQGLDNGPWVDYTTLSGDRMQFAFDGERALNGAAADYCAYPLIKNKHYYSETGSGIFNISYSGNSLSYDFNEWTVNRTGS